MYIHTAVVPKFPLCKFEHVIETIAPRPVEAIRLVRARSNFFCRARFYLEMAAVKGPTNAFNLPSISERDTELKNNLGLKHRCY